MRCLVLLAVCGLCADAGQILVYSSARICQSHMFVMGRIADVLVDAGYNVQEVFPAVALTGTKKARTIVRPIDLPVKHLPHQDLWAQSTEWIRNLNMYRAMWDTMAVACKSQLLDRSHIQNLRAGNYELAIIEYFDVCGMALLEAAGIKKVILVSAFMVQSQLLEALGHPANLAFLPNMDDENGAEMTYCERATALFRYVLRNYVYTDVHGSAITTVVRKYYRADFDPEKYIARNVSYIFINIDEHLGFQIPLSHKFVFIGGPMKQAVPVELDSEFKAIIDNSKKGVVVISFGTIAQSVSMPARMKESIISMVQAFPDVDFVWKYEGIDEIGANLPNLHKKQWMPQAELLAQEKVLGFVTHGGLNSVSEAVHRGKPFVCVPLFADQFNNCFAAAERGLVVVLLKQNLNGPSLQEAVSKIVNDPNYRIRSENFADMIASKPFTAEERIAGYVDHALNFDVQQALDLPSRKLSIVQLYMLDILIPLTVVFCVIPYSINRIADYFSTTVVKQKRE